MTENGRMHLTLPDPDATLWFGTLMARTLPAIVAGAPCQTVLLYGDLGAGKTTLVRALVEALPGGDQAEVSSPSFNLCNLYPTRPETAHYDLYRLEGGTVDESLLETWELGGSLVLVEWAERLPKDCLPESRLELELVQVGEGRGLRLRAHGEGMNWLTPLQAAGTAGAAASNDS